MSGEGSRSTRFAPRNARWAHNHRVTWLDGGASEDLAVFKQRPSSPPSGNGNGHNGHNGNGHNKTLNVTLSEAERERLKAEVVYWGLQQSQQGRMLSEDQLQAEFDRRLTSAEMLLGDLEVDLQQEYDRLRAAEQLLRDREEKQRRARFAPIDPGMAPGMAVGPEPYPQPGPMPSLEPERWSPRPLVSRRNALKMFGLLGLSGAAALGAVKVADIRTQDAVAHGADTGIPPGVLAAGGENPVDGSDDPDPTTIDQVKLAAFNGGKSLYAPFPGPVAKPTKDQLALLNPPPPLPAEPGRVKNFTLTVEEKVIDIAKGVKWWGWTYNGTVPGPVLRVTQGDTVHVTLVNKGQHPHSIHFHSIHPGNQDGVFQVIPAGGTGTYTFTAEPFGVYPYHCHIEPLDQHVARGLYGMMIIDPPKPRPAAKELTMVLNGFDTNFDKANELYAVNGLPGYYHDNPVPLKVGELVRVYLVNMTEFDAVNSFHFHANMFQWYPLGTSLTPSYLTDVVHLGIADRGILEFRYKFPGQFLFHAHQNELTIHGWNAIFNVTA
jgi:FtsP/CotA-like multicopper oxidase with cupredoxin domain